MHACIHTYIQTYIHTYMHLYFCILWVQNIHLCTLIGRALCKCISIEFVGWSLLIPYLWARSRSACAARPQSSARESSQWHWADGSEHNVVCGWWRYPFCDVRGWPGEHFTKRRECNILKMTVDSIRACVCTLKIYWKITQTLCPQMVPYITALEAEAAPMQVCLGLGLRKKGIWIWIWI